MSADTGVIHRSPAAVLAGHPTVIEIVRIAEAMAGPAPGGEPVFYQKQMPHHLYLSGAPLEWMKACRHAILIRAPERMIASFDAKRPAPDLNELAIPQMDRIDSDIADLTGARPPVCSATRTCSRGTTPRRPTPTAGAPTPSARRCSATTSCPTTS